VISTYTDLPDERTAVLSIAERHHAVYCDCGSDDADTCRYTFNIPTMHLKVRVNR
jgi:hypothetical protein